ncbi:hypothetical protein K7711_09075 [Nocardia sp. CA2R105]|uniref:hypothetical protein n=1 Tax=Nocardia coffeae TaxID=2873381 RepID=UPI001CA72945|nr:hypothetical protein [Nocardia coffeae]MBY8856625.1 hypothetical protein [Nocardia coffeae]
MNIDDIACPSCRRTDWVQSLPSIRSTGVSKVSSSETFTAVGFSSNGFVPIIGTSRTEENRTTELTEATAYAPPQIATTCPLVLGLLLTIPAAIVLIGGISDLITHPGVQNPTITTTLGETIVRMIFVLMAAIPAAVAFLIAAIRIRRNGLITHGCSAAYEVWRTGFYCHRCETCYFPITSNERIPARQPLSTAQFRRIVWSAGGYANI